MQKSKIKLLPTDVSDFPTMIEGNYVYVDKTKILYQYFSEGKRLFFLSRPRRFGKSLLLSTLNELFLNNKKLFKDTWIESSDYKWVEYPIINLDFSALSFQTSQEFKIDIIWTLESIAKKYSISISDAPSLATKFKSLIDQLSEKNKVVILIDEYDYPLLKNLDHEDIADAILEVMAGFFGVLKHVSGHLHCLFITGVTKFAKTTLFSGLNNLNDLFVDPSAASLLGYTQQELQDNFPKYIEALATKKNLSIAETYDAIKDWYNGYRFSTDETKVYNPYSVVHLFNIKEFKNFWLETGTPGFLIQLMKKQYYEIKDIETAKLNEQSLGTFEIKQLPLLAILFQTGYITIADFSYASDGKTILYKMTYPNQEVSISFKKYIITSMTQNTVRDVERAADQIDNALTKNDIELFCNTLKSLLANIPYQLHIGSEAFYHSLFQFLVDLLGFQGQSEVSSDKGRIDLVIQTKNRIFIFEFKFKSTGEKALNQIIEKQYYQKYLYLTKPITLVGLSFNHKGKELTLDWVKKDM